MSEVSFQQVQSVLPKPHGRKYECPACGKWNLEITKNGKVLVNCFTNGCPSGAAWNAIVKKLAARDNHNVKHDISTYPGLTLAAYAQNKALPKEQLVWNFGLFNTTWTEYGVTKPGVAFPYFQQVNGAWEWVGSKIRMGSAHQSRWKWQSGFNKDSMTMFGLYNFRDGAIIPDIIICEGESNVQTLAFYDLPAVGVPGSRTWKSEWANLHPIRGAQRVFIHQDPDSAGEEFVRKVAADLPGKEVLVLKLSVKDPSDLHIARRDEPIGGDGAFGRSWDQDAFTWEFNKAVQNAEPPAQSTVEIQSETEQVIEEEPMPQFPKVTGSLADLCEALCPDLPFAHKFISAVTLTGNALSGSIHLKSARHLDPRFYVCLVDSKGSGKSGAITEVRNALAPVLPKVHIIQSIDSGAALVLALYLEPRSVLMPDEMVQLFEKAKTGGKSPNTIAGELLKLYEGHETGNSAKVNLTLPEDPYGKPSIERAVTNAHLSLLAGATAQVFPQMWAGLNSGIGGLTDRFVLVSTGQKYVPEPQRPSDELRVSAALDRLKRQLETAFSGTVTLPDDLAEVQRDWAKDRFEKSTEKMGARMPAILSRFLMMLAVTNDQYTVTRDLLDQALAFGDYQLALRDRLLPADSWSWVQAFEQRIVEVLRRHSKMGMTRNQARRYCQPQRYPGGYGCYLHAWSNLVKAEVLVAVDETERSPIYRLTG